MEQPENPAQSSERTPASAGAAQTRLHNAQRAFELGAYAQLERLLPGLQAQPDSELGQQARRLLRARQVDRVQLAVLAGCALLLAGVIVSYMSP